jgi:hypothetical protein
MVIPRIMIPTSLTNYSISVVLASAIHSGILIITTPTFLSHECQSTPTSQYYTFTPEKRGIL